jgi:hypothetical protein
MPKTTSSRSRARAASSFAWRSASAGCDGVGVTDVVGFAGDGETDRFPAVLGISRMGKSSNWRGSWFTGETLLSRGMRVGKIDRLHRTPAGFTTPVLDGLDFAITRSLVRPGRPRDPVLVHRAVVLLQASFRLRLATTPLRFANPSPPSGWIEDFHLQAIDHARHIRKSPTVEGGAQSRRLRFASVLVPGWGAGGRAQAQSAGAADGLRVVGPMSTYAHSASGRGSVYDRRTKSPMVNSLSETRAGHREKDDEPDRGRAAV